MTLINSTKFKESMMNRYFFQLLAFLVIQIVMTGVVSAQSSLNLPGSVEAGQDFTISWIEFTTEDHGLAEDEMFIDESYRLQRFDVSGDWVTVLQTSSIEPYVENLDEEGVYQYRLIRDIDTVQNEDEGDNFNNFRLTESPVSVTVVAAVVTPPAPLLYSFSYHFVSERHEGDNPEVYGLTADTEVYWQGIRYELDAGEVLEIGTVSQGDVIESTKPLSIGSTKNVVDMPVPIEFAGSEFVIPLVRGTHFIYAKNINDEAIDVDFFDGGTSSTSTIQANEIVRFASSLNGVSATLRSLDQQSRLLVSHNASSNFDAYPVAPAALELFGVRTGGARIGALNDNTTVFQYASNGAVSEQIINAGDSLPVIGSSGSQGLASFVRVVSDKPIGAAQIADGDGGEQTSFIPRSVFARQYVLPTDTQYVAMGCFGAGSTISIYSPNGALLDSTTCSSSDSLPGRAYLGSEINGTQFNAGSRIKSSEPIYLIYEPSSTNDESNLMGENSLVLETRPSTLFKFSFNGGLGNSLYRISRTLDQRFTWNPPEFDSNLYALQSNETVLQRRDSDGNWVTQLPELYTLGSDGSNGYTVIEGRAGIFEYRLLREFTLARIQSGPFPIIRELYVEEPTVVQILEYATSGLGGERLEAPASITLPSESADGNYTVSLDDRHGPSEYVHTNGVVYPIDIRIFYLGVRTLEGGPSAELEDGGDDVHINTSIQNQAPGRYEYFVNYEADLFFEADFNLAVSEGLVENNSSNHDLFTVGLFVFGTTTSQITVLDLDSQGPSGGENPGDGGGVGSPNEDSDGDGINDAFDSYPLQNNTQCFP